MLLKNPAFNAGFSFTIKAVSYETAFIASTSYYFGAGVYNDKLMNLK